MTPRQQRLSPQASMDELSASSISTASGETKPLLLDSSSGGEDDSSSSSFSKSWIANKSNTAANSSSSSRTRKSSSSLSSNNNDNRNNNNNNNNNTANREETPVVVEDAQRVLVSEVTRLQHDYFNLVALVFVIASAAIDWDYDLLFKGWGSLAYKGNYFWLTWGTILGYFLIDLIWVTQIPHCVKSPRTIVQHHLVVLCYMFAPILWPEYRWFMGALLSVEINTWFMILRRVVYKKKIVMLSDAVSFSFYLSWIVIRCGIYPAILLHFLVLAKLAIGETGRLWHWPMIFIPVHCVLCCLNLKWSVDLFYPIVKSWVVRDADKPPAVSNGL